MKCKDTKQVENPMMQFFKGKNAMQEWLKTIFTLDHFQATVNFNFNMHYVCGVQNSVTNLESQASQNTGQNV
jgi:hypothetical protein